MRKNINANMESKYRDVSWLSTVGKLYGRVLRCCVDKHLFKTDVYCVRSN